LSSIAGIDYAPAEKQGTDAAHTGENDNADDDNNDCEMKRIHSSQTRLSRARQPRRAS
jgi:hypothetical protein